MAGKREWMSDSMVMCSDCLNNCDNCVTDVTGLSTLCMDMQCEVGYGITAQRACISCSEGCDYCTIATDGTQVCNTCGSGYDKNTEAGTCVACPENCLSCTYDSVASITTCGLGQCAVNFAQNSAASDLGCVACPEKCSQCTYDTSTSSTQCTAGNCEIGYANNDVDGTCGACGSSCVSCSTSGVGKCDTCITGYRVSSDKLCEKCSSFCSKCSSAGAGKCDSNSCDIDYTLDDNKECKSCSANCYQCNSNGPGSCDTNKCDAEFAYTPTTMTCLSCPNNCYACTVAEDGVTTECTDKQCYPTYGRKSTDKKCHSCPANCLTCEDINLDGVLHCTTCNARFIINSGVCGACPINCATCSWVSEFGLQCDTCLEEYAMDSSDQSCLACPSNCDKCAYDGAAGMTKCDDAMCDEGYAKDAEGQCATCSSLTYDWCSECTDTMTGSGNSSTGAMASVCMECSDGYTMSDDMMSCKTCMISSTANCDECMDRPGKYCETCDAGFLVSDSQEVCGHTCYMCSGEDCDMFSANNMQFEICDSCWVIQETSGSEVNTMRGCFANATCDSTNQQENCREVDGYTQCMRCCTGTNCNTFNIKGSSATKVTFALTTLLAFVLVQFL